MKRTSDTILKGLVYLCTVFSFGILILIVLGVLFRGVPHLKPSMFELKYTTENVSMLPAILNTLEMIVMTLIVVIPIGVATAIYTVEYAKPGSKFVKLTRLMTETLQGIPSIIYGLFGMLFFAYTIGWNMAMISGAMTMAMMCLPLIIRATEEALGAVPNRLREASYGLGAGKLRTVFRVVLPAAAMGIFSGIVLAIGRIVGETAALIFTAGTMAQIAGPFSNGRTLAIHMYLLQTEGRFKDAAYATAVVLLIVVLLINGLSALIEAKIKQKETGK